MSNRAKQVITSPLQVMVWVTVMIAAGLYICGPIIDPDLWWHITVGRWIVAHRAVPQVDYWNMFAAGKPWRAYSWSSEVVLALVEGAWGIKGLLLLKMVVAAALSLSLAYCLGRMARDWFFGGLLGVYATAACFNHFTLRPQSLVWILFIWVIYFADQIDRQGLNLKRSLSLAGIMLLWANSHLTSALGVALAAAGVLRGNRRGLALKTALICVAGTLCTPYLGGEWITLFQKSGHPFSHAAIAEFKPATILQYSTGFLLVLAALLMVFLHHRPRALSLPRLGAALALMLAGLAVVKFLPFAVIYLCSCAASIWAAEGEDRSVLGGLPEAVERLRKMWSWLPETGVAFVFICAGYVSAAKAWAAPLDRELVPVSAVDFIQEHHLPHPILNDFGRGGYLMFRFSDARGDLRHKVPLDGRTNVNDPEIWQKFFSTLQGKNNWRGYLDAVMPGTILWPVESPLTSILLEGSRWCEVYRVGNGERGYAVYVQRDYFRRHLGKLPSVNCTPAKMDARQG